MIRPSASSSSPTSGAYVCVLGLGLGGGGIVSLSSGRCSLYFVTPFGRVCVCGCVFVCVCGCVCG
jgi:hypothetical protein